MCTVETAIPSPQEVRDQLADVGRQIAALTFHREYVIADYPIGRRERGQCKMEVEFTKKGFRTVKTTTNKYGRWCAPKKSTFSESVTVVVTGDGLDPGKEVAWLYVSRGGIGIGYANGAGEQWAKAPHYCTPRRVDHHYTIESRSYGSILTLGKSAPVVTTQDCVSKADPPELCDAYDAWTDGLRPIVTMVIDRIKKL